MHIVDENYKSDSVTPGFEPSESDSMKQQQHHTYPRDLKCFVWISYIILKNEIPPIHGTINPDTGNTLILIAHLALCSLAIPKQWSHKLNALSKIEEVIDAIIGIITP